jgi:hypothetical protein
MNLRYLADRPASSVTDVEVAAALEIIRADARVSKAVHIGREHGAADGRQMIDFEMTGFAGVHTLGRVISAFQEADRLAAKAAEKARLDAAKARKKAAAERERLLKLPVPREGADEGFEDFGYDMECDLVGVPGVYMNDPVERARMYEAYLKSLRPTKPPQPRWTGPSLTGLSGSTKQKHWASRIIDGYTGGLVSRREGLIAAFPKAKFWIENRNNLAAAISKAMK